MRVAFVLTILLAAGCLGATTPKPDEPGAAALYKPDCTLGAPDGNWTETCVVKASPNPSPSKAEIDLVVNPKDPQNVVTAAKDLDRKASNCVWAVPEVSKDGGKTWTSVYIGGERNARKPGDPLYGWECITDPILAFNKDGVLFYSLQVYNYMTGGAGAAPLEGAPVSNAGSEILLARSKDGGLTWDKIVTEHVGDGTAIFHDYMRMAANPKTGTVYTIWNQLSVAVSQPVLVASADGGETVRPPVYFPQTDSPSGLGESAIFADNDGTVYVLFGGLNSGGDVYVATSTDDAQTFTAPTKVFSTKPIDSPLPNSTFRVGTSVEGAIDRSSGGHKGCLYAAWADGGKGHGDAEILAARSCDKGKTWTKPVRVNQDATASDQFMPRVAVDDAGAVHVAYITRAYDPGNKLLDAESAVSTDGGATWVATRLTTRSWDGDKGVHQDGFPFYGDYIGIDSAKGVTYVAFPDCATGVCEIGVAKIARAG